MSWVYLVVGYGVGLVIGRLVFPRRFRIIALVLTLVVAFAGWQSLQSANEDRAAQERTQLAERRGAERTGVPATMLGEWRSAGNSPAARISVRAGERGDVVADLRITGQCVALVTLAEAYEREVVLRAAPTADLADSCEYFGWSAGFQLTIGNGNELAMTGVGPLVSLGSTLTQLPAAFVGEWQGQPDARREYRFTVQAGGIGELVAQVQVGTSAEECVASARLVRAYQTEIELDPEPADDMTEVCRRLGWWSQFHLTLVDQDELSTHQAGPLVRP